MPGNPSTWQSYGVFCKVPNISGKKFHFARIFNNIGTFIARLFHKNEVNCGNEADESGEVIPLQRLAFEEEYCEKCEDDEGYDFLYDL